MHDSRASIDPTAAAPLRPRAVITRRALLGGTLAAAAGLGLAGCGVDPSLGTLGVAATEGASGTEAGGDWGQDGLLRVGMEAGYPPNNWQEEEPTDSNIPIENVEGAYADGYDVQIAKRLAEGLDLEPVAVKMEFTGLISALNGGQIDVIIAGMLDTPERKESCAFSESYSTYFDYVMLVPQGSPYADAESIDDFAGATVLGQTNTLLDDVIDQIPDVKHATPVDSTADMIARVKNGTVDAITFDIDSGRGYTQNDDSLVMVEFEKGKGFELGYTGSCVGIRKGDTDLLEKVNAILAEIPEEERQEIMDWAIASQPAA